MNLLLDTHVLVGFISPKIHRLSVSVEEALNAADNGLFVSVASIWEIAIKTRLRKLDLGAPADTVPAAMEGLGATLLLINQHHVLADLTHEPNTRDPFDRLLLAQCQVENLRLVTEDRALVSHPLAWQQ